MILFPFGFRSLGRDLGLEEGDDRLVSEFHLFEAGDHSME
jgi:hypothetical protein